MADVMTFPKTMKEFVDNYSFKDRDEVYTNGSMLIQTFRVEQAIEHYEKEICKKLADYEQAEEDGLLIRLPCKVGDVIYYFMNVDGVKVVAEHKIARISNLVYIMEEEVFGKTVFLTKAEAEQALAKMKGE